MLPPIDRPARHHGSLAHSPAVALVWRRRDRELRRRLLDGEDLSGANLRHASLAKVDAPRARLRGANLTGADLRKIDLRWSDLRSARLKGSQLDGAQLAGANLTGADLRYATLVGSVFEGASLGGIRLRGAVWDDTTVWPKDFVPVEGR
jgi:uncharacterized protein YjbI with pentapeptide repeats